MIFPADDPKVAEISGYGLNLRLEHSYKIQPLTIRLIGDFSDENLREIYSPDGVCVRLIDEKHTIEIPEGTQ